MKTKYQSLELDKVLEKVASYSTCSLAKEYILNEEVDFNPLLIKRNIDYTKEAYDYLSNNLRLDFSDVKDINNILAYLDKGLTLSSSELVSILNHNVQIKRIIKNLGNTFKNGNLNDFIISLYFNDHIIDIINKHIDLNGEIRDDATSTLKDLYRHLKNIENEINVKAQQFLKTQNNSLQESVIYQRDGRICFLIRNSDKNKYDGYSHGLSASGQAVYIEPKIFVELNNRLNDIKVSIDEEIKRILSEISYEVSKYTKMFYHNLESIMYLDMIFAKAMFGIDNKGVLAKINEDNLSLINIGHPLIDKEKLIKNSYNLLSPIKGIVISGSNTGGKTVSLKVIALSVLMTYLGIPLICDEANIPLYDAIYDDIDDNQSIIDSLSTFSARLVSLNKILNKMTNKSLVLIDEIASGTDPKEGEALALAIIRKLINKNVSFVITTHFNKVKEYALSNEKIILSSQEFDTINLVPTYRYIENAIGNSNALDIAIRYIDDIDLINDAKDLLIINQTDEEKILKSLESKQKELDLKEEELNTSILKQAQINEELNRKLKDFENSKEELFKKAQIKANHYLEKQKAKIKKILDEIEKTKNTSNKKEVIESINHIKKEMKIETKKNDFKIGDGVKIISTSQIGVLEDIKKDRVVVNIHGIILKTTLDNLEYYDLPVKEVNKHVEKSFKRAKSEVLLVGMHVEEALDTLAIFLDNAYGSGLKQVKIIHGSGTGALRKAVAEYLKKQSFVKKFHYGDSYDGGNNVTIVELK